MTNPGRWSLAAAAVVLLLVSSPIGAQHDQDMAIVAMNAFLTSWLVHDDMATTVMHFGASDPSLSLAPTYVLDFGEYDPDVVGNERQLARGHAGATAGDWPELPPGVAFGYWRLLRSLWPDAGRVGIDLNELLVTDPELIAFLDENFDVEYVQKSPFIVFPADEHAELETFDAGFAAGGYGQLVKALKPSKDHAVLTMIADFRYARSKRIGPLVTFWDEEVSETGERAWRIQALGAFPEN